MELLDTWVSWYWGGVCWVSWVTWGGVPPRPVSSPRPQGLLLICRGRKRFVRGGGGGGGAIEWGGGGVVSEGLHSKVYGFLLAIGLELVWEIIGSYSYTFAASSSSSSSFSSPSYSSSSSSYSSTPFSSSFSLLLFLCRQFKVRTEEDQRQFWNFRRIHRWVGVLLLLLSLLLLLLSLFLLLLSLLPPSPLTPPPSLLTPSHSRPTPSVSDHSTLLLPLLLLLLALLRNAYSHSYLLFHLSSFSFSLLLLLLLPLFQVTPFKTSSVIWSPVLWWVFFCSLLVSLSSLVYFSLL